MPRRRFTTVRDTVMKNIEIALNYIEDAYSILDVVLKEEKKLDYNHRHQLYNYGITDASIHKVRLANIKKSIFSMMEKKEVKISQDSDHMY